MLDVFCFGRIYSGAVLAEPEVSVVVCTRGRPELLQRALASLAVQTVERSRFEVIVVDNGGGVEGLARSAGADLVLREPAPGVSRARNAGWRAAASGLVAYLDDDAVAAGDWLEQALRVRSEYGEASALGGPILPLWETPRPTWFPESLEDRWFGDEERILSPGESLSGSNVFFTRALLDRLGGFDIRLGPIGDRMGLGEEMDLFGRMWAEEPHSTAVYSPAVVVSHSVAPYKLSVRYQLRRAVAYGESVIMRQQIPLGHRPHLVGEYLGDVLRFSRVALRQIRRPLRRWALEELEPAAIRLGMLLAVVRGK